jgi:hypothetical protein
MFGRPDDLFPLAVDPLAAQLRDLAFALAGQD